MNYELHYRTEIGQVLFSKNVPCNSHIKQKDRN